MSRKGKHAHRGSDIGGMHAESLAPASGPNIYREIRESIAKGLWRVARRREVHGKNAYTSDSGLCACGTVATRVWQNTRWCSKCYAASLSLKA